MTRRLLTACAIAAVAVTTPRAQQPAPQTFRGSVDLIAVDVQVVDTSNSTHWNGSAFVAGTSGFVAATGTTSWSDSLAAFVVLAGLSLMVADTARVCTPSTQCAVGSTKV